VPHGQRPHPRTLWCSQMLCAAGKFSSRGQPCTSCPAGRFGTRAGQGSLSTACDGVCVAPAGSYCGLGTSSPVGIPCPIGYYAADANQTSCAPCSAASGWYCASGSTTFAGVRCPAGRFSAGGTADCIQGVGPSASGERQWLVDAYSRMSLGNLSAQRLSGWDGLLSPSADPCVVCAPWAGVSCEVFEDGVGCVVLLGRPQGRPPVCSRHCAWRRPRTLCDGPFCWLALLCWCVRSAASPA
jgi:hypothetical protein